MPGHIDVLSTQIPDTELVKQVLEGEKRLFEVIIRRYNQRLYRMGMSLLDNAAEVEDAMQTTYINAYEHLAQFEHRSSLLTWLTRIMLNQCYEQKRKKQLSLTGVVRDTNTTNMKTPANILVNKELSSALENAVARLPEKYRLVFVLREMNDLSVKETAEALNIEEPNVKVRLNRAKSMLRDHLDSYMKDHVYSFHLTRCEVVTNYVLTYLKII